MQKSNTKLFITLNKEQYVHKIFLKYTNIKINTSTINSL